MASPRLQRLSLLLALAWMGTIFFLSHQPSLPAPSLFEHQDKLFHGGSYGLLGLLLAVALRDPAHPGRTLWIAWLLGSLYGLADEYHQSLVPGRDADLLDVLADSAGAWLGGVAGALFMRRLHRR